MLGAGSCGSVWCGFICSNVATAIFSVGGGGIGRGEENGRI